MRGNNVPLPAIWGNCQTAGIICYEKVDRGQLLVIWEVCHGPIGAMTFTVEGKTPAQLGWILGTDYEIFLGTKNQALSTILSARDANWTSALPGKAYVVAIVSAKGYATAIPNHESFLAQVTQGLLVRDPRLGVDGNGIPNQPRVAAGTDNPGLMWADFKSSKRYGEGVPDANIDWASVTTVANDDDAAINVLQPTAAPSGAAGAVGLLSGTLYFAVTNVSAQGFETMMGPVSAGVVVTNQKVNLSSIPLGNSFTTKRNIYYAVGSSGGPFFFGMSINDNTSTTATFDGTQANSTQAPLTNPQYKRYTSNYKLEAGMSLDPISVVRDMGRQAMFYEAYNAGKYMIWTDKAQSASGIVFDDTDVRAGGNDNIADAWFRVKGQGELPTRVRGNFIDVVAGYRDAYAEDVDLKIAQQLIEDVPSVMDLHATPCMDQAARLCVQYRNKSSLDKEYTFVVGPEGAQLLPGGRFVATSAQLNVSAVDFQCVSLKPSGSYWIILAVLYDAAVFSDTPINKIVSAGTAFPSPLDPPEPPGSVYDVTSAYAWWNLPPIRTKITLAAAAWSSSGTSFFDNTKIQDGNQSVAAATFNNANVNSTITWDFGSARKLNEVVLRMTAVGGGLTNGIGTNETIKLIIEWADSSGGPWTQAATEPGTFWSAALTDTRPGADPNKFWWSRWEAWGLFTLDPAIAAHQFWRLKKTDGAAVTVSITDVELIQYTGAKYQFAKGWRIRGVTKLLPDSAGNTFLPNPQVRHEVDIFWTPTSGNPFKPELDNFNCGYSSTITDVLMGTIFFSSGGFSEFEIATIAPDGQVSEFRGFKARVGPLSSSASAGAPDGLLQKWIPLGQVNASGANAGIDSAAMRCQYNKDIVRVINGTATGDFNVFGMAPGYEGARILVLNDTSYNVTLKNQSGSEATAANRFSLGRDYRLIPGESILLYYDSNASRWKRSESLLNSIDTDASGNIGIGAVPFASNVALGITRAVTTSTQLIDIRNLHASGSAAVQIVCGDGTTSPRNAYLSLFSNETTTQSWYFGMFGSKSITLRDVTASRDDIVIDTSGKVGIIMTPSAQLDVAGVIRSISSTGTPTTGVGVEIIYTGTDGAINSYDRTNTVAKPMHITGSTLALERAFNTPDYKIDANGNNDFFGGSVAYANRLDKTITGNTNDLDIVHSTYIRLTGTPGAFNLTGANNGRKGRILIIQNESAVNCTLTNQDVLSAAANRFKLRGAANYVLATGTATMLLYDDSLSRWVQING